MMAMDGMVVLEGGHSDTQFWAYGAGAEAISTTDATRDTLFYLAGPDGYTLKVPRGIDVVKMATVVARNETDSQIGKAVRIVAHPDSAIEFEASERVSVHVTGSNCGDVMVGPVYAGAVFEGGAGNDLLVAASMRRNDDHAFYGGAGNDTLRGGNGRDTLDGGPGDNEIYGGDGFNTIYGGTGNDKIFDGDHSSTIHTGSGRNEITSGSGSDQFFVGPGENRITSGEGGVTYHVAWGGLLTITQWHEGDTISLATWPVAPTYSLEDGRVLIQAGLSFVEVLNATDIETIKNAVIAKN
jgi:Ca2+-binding RTX toxin-like protein